MNPDSETAMNQLRAGWAEAAVHAFAAKTGQQDVAHGLDDRCGFTEIVGDLICNLGHLAIKNGWETYEFRELVRSAVDGFHEEYALAEDECFDGTGGDAA